MPFVMCVHGFSPHFQCTSRRPSRAGRSDQGDRLGVPRRGPSLAPNAVLGQLVISPLLQLPSPGSSGQLQTTRLLVSLPQLPRTSGLAGWGQGLAHVGVLSGWTVGAGDRRSQEADVGPTLVTVFPRPPAPAQSSAFGVPASMFPEEAGITALTLL